nr:protein DETOXIFICATION 16-like [Ipomoea batatas]
MRSIIRRQTVQNAGNLYAERNASDASSQHSGGRLLGLHLPNPQVLRGTDPEISDAAGEYARFLIPSIFPYAILRCLISFLQAQNNVVPMMFTAGIAALVHVLSCWILVFKSGMGFNGAAMANAISYWVNVVLLGVYVRVSPSCKETWAGFSKDMFHDIIKFLRLGIPSTAMLCASHFPKAGWNKALWRLHSLPTPVHHSKATKECFFLFFFK